MKSNNTNTLFNYIEQTQSKTQSLEVRLLKIYALLLILTIAIRFIFNGFTIINFDAVLLQSTAQLSAIVVIVYLYLKIYLKYDSKTLFAPIPDSVGNILSKFHANNLQTDSKNNKRVINGLLIIGDKSIAFIPYKYSIMKLKTVELHWQDINSIYRGSGSLLKNWLMKFDFYNKSDDKNMSKIVIETIYGTYYFQAFPTDQIIDDLNTFKESL